MKQDSFLVFVQDQLSGLRGTSFRPMFGGWGVYQDRSFFAIVFKGRLYFKVGDGTRAAYAAKGAGPFKPGPGMTLKSFHGVPDDVLEDREEIVRWAKEAVEAARARKAPAPRGSRRGAALFLAIALVAMPPFSALSATLRGQAALSGDVSAAAPPVWTDAPGDEPASRRARPSRPSRPAQFFGQLDLWTKDDAYARDEEAAGDFGLALLAGGYDAAAVDASFTGGLGVRVGFLKPEFLFGLDAGGSVGYVLGPSLNTTVTGYSLSAGDGQFRDELETSFFRALVEVMKEVPLTRLVRLRLRGGGGAAWGTIAAEDRSSGSFVTSLGFPDHAVFEHRWVGFTWEFLPSLVFKGSALDVEVGLGVAGFPDMKETDEFYEFRWRPIGLRLGLEFS